MGRLVGGILVARFECDQKLPAFYLRFTEEIRIHHSVDEDCTLIVDPGGDLVGLDVSLSDYSEEFPNVPLSRATQFCAGDGWLCRAQAPSPPPLANSSETRSSPLLSKEFRKPNNEARRVPCVVTLDVDQEGTILGLECVLTGNTDGVVRFDWLCQAIL